MSDLVRTWFSPFKQTYVGTVKGSIGVHIRAAVDKLISRVIGFIVRTILLIAGAVCGVIVFVTGLAFVLIWPIIPLLPALAIILFAMGVGV